MIRYPQVFWLFLLFLPLLFLFYWRYKIGKTAVLRFGGKWRGRTLHEVYVVKWFFSTLGFVFFLAGAILALAGFPGGVKKEPFSAAGWDTVFVVDISRSMLAQDVLPSRLDKARGIIHGMINGQEASRFGLVIFRGEGSLLFPLSEDSNGLLSALGIISPDLMSTPGTNIARGLERALDSFISGRETGQRVILFSDGEEISGDVAGLLHRFRDSRVELTVIGVGKTDGAFIPLADGSKVKDSQGRDVVSRLNRRMLERLAEQAGGRYYSAEDPNLQSLLLKNLGSGSAGDVGGGFIEVKTESYRIFLFLSLLGLLLFQGVKAGRWKDNF